EKGFRDIDVRGPFSFAVSISVLLISRLPERLIEVAKIARYPFSKRFTVSRFEGHCQCLIALFRSDTNSLVGRNPWLLVTSAPVIRSVFECVVNNFKPIGARHSLPSLGLKN